MARALGQRAVARAGPDVRLGRRPPWTPWRLQEHGGERVDEVAVADAAQVLAHRRDGWRRRLLPPGVVRPLPPEKVLERGRVVGGGGGGGGESIL